ncbi:MAG: histidinol-phosphatase [Rhodospirillales bacterium]|nr:histidinol-phosphatase [Rhodospirillales bacterium]MCW9001801.1 histidinol-phosphatase [Rhodospirillales bacterium]MCW9040255.1 histidinol-phosphatase [Rhodospirillales bacterium]
MFIDLAVRLADTARPIVTGYFRSGLAVDDKDDASPVTRADRETESAVRAIIDEALPDHGIIGEEHGRIRTDSEYVWVIDPIDGTKSFITGKPLFGTLIALCRNGTPILGIIDAPALGERWIGARGRETVFNGAPARTRACATLDRAVLYTTSPDLFSEEDGTAVAFRSLKSRIKLPMYGGDCYAYGLLASGFTDLVCETGLKPYDFCALVPVVEGAGGTITDWNGRPMTILSDGHVLASGDAALHKRALLALQP